MQNEWMHEWMHRATVVDTWPPSIFKGCLKNCRALLFLDFLDTLYGQVGVIPVIYLLFVCVLSHLTSDNSTCLRSVSLSTHEDERARARPSSCYFNLSGRKLIINTVKGVTAKMGWNGAPHIASLDCLTLLNFSCVIAILLDYLCANFQTSSYYET